MSDGPKAVNNNKPSPLRDVRATDQPLNPASITAQVIEGIVEASHYPTMTSQQLRMLLALYPNVELTQSAMGKIGGVEDSAVSRNIGKLAGGWKTKREGEMVELPGLRWVEHFNPPMDNRSKHVRLTPLGHAQLTVIFSKLK